MMKALVVTGPGEYEWAELPQPTPAADQALVRIEVCGICNSTDRELVEGTQPYRPAFPFVLGHEAVGTVVEVGSAVTRFKVGDRVTRAASILPGTQLDGINSGWGGFAEYGLVMENDQDYQGQRQLVLPSDVPPERAFLSISLAETRAFVDQIAESAGPIRGRAAVVVGTGIAGLTMTRWLRESEAHPVITLGRRPERLLLARKCGAHATFELDDADLPARLAERTRGRGAELLFEAIGKPAAWSRLMPLLAPGATIAVYGAAEADSYQQAFALVPAGVTVLKPGPEEFRYTAKMARWLCDGTISPGLFRTHLWRPEEIHTALTQVASGQVVKGAVWLV